MGFLKIFKKSKFSGEGQALSSDPNPPRPANTSSKLSNPPDTTAAVAVATEKSQQSSPPKGKSEPAIQSKSQPISPEERRALANKAIAARLAPREPSDNETIAGRLVARKAKQEAGKSLHTLALEASEDNIRWREIDAMQKARSGE